MLALSFFEFRYWNNFGCFPCCGEIGCLETSKCNIVGLLFCWGNFNFCSWYFIWSWWLVIREVLNYIFDFGGCALLLWNRKWSNWFYVGNFPFDFVFYWGVLFKCGSVYILKVACKAFRLFSFLKRMEFCVVSCRTGVMVLEHRWFYMCAKGCDMYALCWTISVAMFCFLCELLYFG